MATTSKPLRTLYPAGQNPPKRPAPAATGGAGVGGVAPSSQPLPSVGGAIGVQPGQTFQPIGVSQRQPGIDFWKVRDRDLLGNLGFAITPENYKGRKDLPYIQARLNFDNLLLSEQDRQASYDLLRDSLAGIGRDAESALARETAVERLLNPGAYDELVAGARARAASGLEGGMRELRQGLAARGLGGGPTSFQAALLRQAAERGLAEDTRAAELARYDAEGGALGTLEAMAADDEARRLAVIAQINELLGQERGSFDLSGLAR